MEFQPHIICGIADAEKLAEFGILCSVTKVVVCYLLNKRMATFTIVPYCEHIAEHSTPVIPQSIQYVIKFRTPYSAFRKIFSPCTKSVWQPIREFHVSDREPPPLKSEFSTAIKKLNNRKSPAADGIRAELYKHGGPMMIDVIHQLCLEVWETGEWPVD